MHLATPAGPALATTVGSPTSQYVRACGSRYAEYLSWTFVGDFAFPLSRFLPVSRQVTEKLYHVAVPVGRIYSAVYIICSV